MAHGTSAPMPRKPSLSLQLQHLPHHAHRHLFCMSVGVLTMSTMLGVDMNLNFELKFIIILNMSNFVKTKREVSGWTGLDLE